MKLTSQLARFCASLQSQSIPSDVRQRAAALSLDGCSIAVRASHDGDSTKALLGGLGAAGLAGGSCTILGVRSGLGPAAASAVNAALIHTLDFDDTHIGASIHVTAPVVAAALAAAETVGADGRLTVTGIVAGMEAMTRIGRALVPPRHYARGFHPTATSGVFGATAAAGVILGLDDEAIVNAFGIALSSVSGTLQFHANGAWTKRLQVGFAAEGGVRAAFLSQAGFRGAADAIEGKHGLLNVFTDRAQPNLIAEGLGSAWEVLEIGVKPYPACRFAHAALDALLSLQADHGFVANDVRRVEIGLSRKAIAAVAEPEGRKRHASNIVDAQFSVYFLAAAAMLNKGVRWDDYPDLLGRPDVDAFADKVHVLHDERIEALYPARMAGHVVVHLMDGREFALTVESPAGEPDRFPTEAAMTAKAMDLLLPVLGPEQSALFCSNTLDIERLGPMPMMSASYIR